LDTWAGRLSRESRPWYNKGRLLPPVTVLWRPLGHRREENQKNIMTKRMIIMLAIVGVFFGGVFGWKAFVGFKMAEFMSSQPMPTVTVSTAVASHETWSPEIPSIGTLRASQGVDITAQEPGIITELLFDSGEQVKAGAVLARQFVDDERARLDALEADVQLAELNLARARDLLKKDLNSQFDYDSRKTDYDRAVARARNVRLIIEKKTIRAPFSGRIGIRRVDLGQYIQPGEPIVRLEALEKILVDFPVSQRHMSRIRTGQPLVIEVDAWPDEAFEGAITAIAPQVQSTTRNIRLEGLVDNEAGRLLPGMFAEVTILQPAVEEVVTVPQASITFSPYGDSVFTISETTGANGEPMLVAKNVFVTTGDTRGDQIAIVSGIAAGDAVVTAGHIKLRDGVPVRVDNSIPVSNLASSIPENN
jgi:membrane fusion protein (multidrug efflux system)